MAETNNGKYNFFLQGNKDTAILLIHGITGTPSEMHYLGRSLHKAGFTVFCNTLPRHCGTLTDLKKVTWQEVADTCAKDLKFLKEKHSRVFVSGISMGALVAIHLAFQFPLEVSGIIAFAPTISYDGWAVHKGKVFMYSLWHIPFFRNMMNIREGWPYGLKDEQLRGSIERFYKKAKAGEFDKKVIMFGSPFFPVACLYQHTLFAKLVKKELAMVKTPILVLHADHDDMASIKNAEYIMKTIGSADKKLVVLKDSYHMIVIDKEKDKVVEETTKFLGKF